MTVLLYWHLSQIQESSWMLMLQIYAPAIRDLVGDAMHLTIVESNYFLTSQLMNVRKEFCLIFFFPKFQLCFGLHSREGHERSSGGPSLEASKKRLQEAEVVGRRRRRSSIDHTRETTTKPMWGKEEKTNYYYWKLLLLLLQLLQPTAPLACVSKGINATWPNISAPKPIFWRTVYIFETRIDRFYSLKIVKCTAGVNAYDFILSFFVIFK